MWHKDAAALYVEHRKELMKPSQNSSMKVFELGSVAIIFLIVLFF